jgi:hypothetical protein
LTFYGPPSTKYSNQGPKFGALAKKGSIQVFLVLV